MSRLAAERGGVELMPELGYRPSNRYLPPRERTDHAITVAAPPLQAVEVEGGFLGWVDRVLSR